jgi:anti-sigma28 factor (negative regulator of flagellin synthesis)
VRISSNYLQLINRILTEEPGKPSSGSSKASARAEDRKEISHLVTVLQQEMERVEGEAAPDRAARLESLAEQIKQGTYHVESKALAEAMLKFYGKI